MHVPGLQVQPVTQELARAYGHIRYRRLLAIIGIALVAKL